MAEVLGAARLNPVLGLGDGEQARRPSRPASGCEAEGEPPSHTPVRKRRWTALRIAWTGLLAVLLGAGGWLAWLLVGTNVIADGNARALMNDYQEACSAGTSLESPVLVLGWITFPGHTEKSWPIVAGVGGHELSSGVGWYPQTAEPGQVGNMVLTGYRITNGAPFEVVPALQAGDRVQVTACEQAYTYLITVAPSELTVQAGDDWVLDAVPGEPSQVPTGRMITLITSQDLLPTADRSVGFGVLEQA